MLQTINEFQYKYVGWKWQMSSSVNTNFENL